MPASHSVQHLIKCSPASQIRLEERIAKEAKMSISKPIAWAQIEIRLNHYCLN